MKKCAVQLKTAMQIACLALISLSASAQAYELPQWIKQLLYGDKMVNQLAGNQYEDGDDGTSAQPPNSGGTTSTGSSGSEIRNCAESGCCICDQPSELP